MMKSGEKFAGLEQIYHGLPDSRYIINSWNLVGTVISGIYPANGYPAAAQQKARAGNLKCPQEMVRFEVEIYDER